MTIEDKNNAATEEAQKAASALDDEAVQKFQDSFKTNPYGLRTLVCEYQPLTDGNGSRASTAPRTYEYLYVGAKDVSVGDHAFVHNGTNFGVVKIVRIRPGITDKVTKNVIDVITRAEWDEYQERNKRINEHRKVYDELDYLIEENKKHERYRRLAEHDPRAASLLSKITGFTGVNLLSTDKDAA